MGYSDLYDIINNLINRGYLVHATNKDFNQFDYNKIIGGSRAKEGYGFYFSDMAYKPIEYGNNIKAIKKEDFNFINLTDPIDLSLFYDIDKYNRLKEIKEKLKNARSLREELMLEDEYDKLRDYLLFNCNKALFDDIVEAINEGAKNYGQLQSLIRDYKKNIPLICKAMVDNGYDGFYYDHVYTVFNFDKLNRLVINNAEKLIESKNMKQIKLNEGRLDQIIKEELDLFGYDTSAYDAAQAKKAKRSAAAKKGAETKKANKDKANDAAQSKLDKDMISAFSNDMFGDNPTEKERQKAKERVLSYGQELKKKKKAAEKKKKKNKKN